MQTLKIEGRRKVKLTLGDCVGRRNLLQWNCKGLCSTMMMANVMMMTTTLIESHTDGDDDNCGSVENEWQ